MRASEQIPVWNKQDGERERRLGKIASQLVAAVLHQEHVPKKRINTLCLQLKAPGSQSGTLVSSFVIIFPGLSTTVPRRHDRFSEQRRGVISRKSVMGYDVPYGECRADAPIW